MTSESVKTTSALTRDFLLKIALMVFIVLHIDLNLSICLQFGFGIV
jgi:hypothetical protein